MNKRIKPVVVCISGNKRHGKNTVAALMAEHLRELNENLVIEEYAFAEAVRELCAKLLFLPADTSWFQELKDKPLPRLLGLVTGRDVLKFVGTGIVRRLFPAHWADEMVKKLLQSEADYVFLTDCRFANELEALEKPSTLLVHVRVYNPEAPEPYYKDVTEQLFVPDDVGCEYAKNFRASTGELQYTALPEPFYEHWHLYNDADLGKLKAITELMVGKLRVMSSNYYRGGIYQ